MKKRQTQEPQFHDDLPHWNALIESVRQQRREQQDVNKKHKQDKQTDD